MARKFNVQGVELRPSFWFGGYIAEVDGRRFRIVRSSPRQWQALSPVFPFLGRPVVWSKTLRGAVADLVRWCDGRSLV